jgi:hypothetical protein
MRNLLVASALLAAFCVPGLAQNGGNDNSGGNNNNQDNGYHGAPGPVAGAGLPILAVGYGVYWLVQRRRKAQ